MEDDRNTEDDFTFISREVGFDLPVYGDKVGENLYYYSEKDIENLKKEDSTFSSSGLSGPGYYFSDEAYFLHGPYKERKEAVEALSEYARILYLGLDMEGDI